MVGARDSQMMKNESVQSPGSSEKIYTLKKEQSFKVKNIVVSHRFQYFIHPVYSEAFYTNSFVSMLLLD